MDASYQTADRGNTPMTEPVIHRSSFQSRISCQDCAISELCLPVALLESEVEHLDSIIKRNRPLQKGEHLFRAGDPLPRIRALHFFRPVIEELIEEPCDPDYIGYLEHKLRPLADQKLRSRGTPGVDPQHDEDDG